MQQSYVFKHALVRDVAYESLLKSKRKVLHRRVAKALENEFREKVEAEPELLAHHYTEAGIAEAAIEYWLRAGRGAGAHGSYAEAIAHLKRGLALLETLPRDGVGARAEINFRIALGVPLLSVAGVTSHEVAKNYEQARVLCEKTGERAQLFPVVWGLWYHHMMGSELRQACALADQLLEVAWDQNDENLLLEAHHCQWASRLLIGDLSAALKHSEQGISIYRADAHHALTFTFGGHDPGVCAHDQNALALWLSGYPERAQKRCEEALNLSRGLDHAGTLANQLGLGIALSTFQRDIQALWRQAQGLSDLGAIEQAADWQPLVEGACGLAMFEGGEHEAGLALMRKSIESGLVRDPWEMVLASLLATAFGRSSSADEGLAVIDETLRWYQHDDVHWWDAELYRVRGELLLASGESGGAEDCFRQAIDTARQQLAKSLELRAATSLARLWGSQKKQRTAAEFLAPIYDWFTEGFETPDLKEAKSLLEELS